MRAFTLFAVLATVAVGASSQSPLPGPQSDAADFEVASIKRSPPRGDRGGPRASRIQAAFQSSPRCKNSSD